MDDIVRPQPSTPAPTAQSSQPVKINVQFGQPQQAVPVAAPQPMAQPVPVPQPTPIAIPVTPQPQPVARPAPLTETVPEQPSAQPPTFAAPAKPQVPRSDKKSKKRLIKFAVIGVGAVLVLFAGNMIVHNIKESRKPYVASGVTSAADFPLYYPNPKKLPKGYELDRDSFRSPAKNGVTYNVIYEKTKRIIFNLQSKPTDADLASFKKNYLKNPKTQETPVGTADIGTSSGQTLASIVTSDGPWITVSAPSDVPQDTLVNILNVIEPHQATK